MNDSVLSIQSENIQRNGPTVSQMPLNQHTRYLSDLAQSNSAAFGQALQSLLQQQAAGYAGFAQGGGALRTSPMRTFAGAFPQAGDAPYIQLFPQPIDSSATHMNTASALTSLAVDSNRPRYSAAIPGSRDHDAVVASRLRQALRKGCSYKEALHDMHGVRLRAHYSAHIQLIHTIHRFSTFLRACGSTTTLRGGPSSMS